jgi:DNA primase
MSQALEAWNNLRERIRLVPISSVIGKYISLSKKGANYEAICPFHKDTHPSLKVNDPKNLFKCFACGMAGDSVKFVMEFKKITYKEALESLAHDFNLPIPTKQTKKVNPKVQAYLDCHAIALQFYLDITQKEYMGEMSHFAQDRKLNTETMQRFKICYAPEGKHLANYLLNLKNNFNSAHYDTALELGLIKLGENGHYDTFRRRILFPILNTLGQVVAFGSRATHDGQMPKYLNSQESLIFNKRQVLYGLPLARAKIREHAHVFIVEGYMDAIMMHQAGFDNTVAVMGIAFTEEHFKELGPGIKNYYLLFDQDQAGEIAAKRALPLLLKHKVFPLRVDLLNCKDPDEFIKTQGVIGLQNQVQAANSWLDYLLNQLSLTPTGQNIDAKLDVLKLGFELLKPLQNELSATERIIQFAKKIGLNSPENSLLEQFQSYLKGQTLSHPTIAPRNTPSSTEVIAPTTLLPELPQESSEKTAKNESFDKEELFLLKQILKNPNLIKLENFTEVLEFVNNRQIKDLLKFLPKMVAEIEFADFEQTLIALIDEKGFAPEIKQLACEVFFQWSPQTQVDDAILKKQFLDIKKKILIEKLIREKTVLKLSHKNLTSEQDLQEVLRKVHSIDKKIFELKSSDNFSGLQKD